MKKLITLALTLIMAIAFAACGGNDGNGGGLGDITVPGNSSSPGENTAAPGQTESQTQQPGGNIDPKIIGSWECGVLHMNDPSWYIFNADGTFTHADTWFLDTYSGKYHTLGGKVYLTDMTAYRKKPNGDIQMYFEKDDVILEYEFGTLDSGEEYLLIYEMSRTGANNDQTYFTLEGADRYLRD